MDPCDIDCREIVRASMEVPIEVLVGEAETSPRQEKTLTLYADGSCVGNGTCTAKAGIGVYHREGSRFNLSEPWTAALGKASNQRAELQAAIRALEVTMEPGTCDELEILTDSIYVVRGITEWIKAWKKNGWRNANKKPVSNVDLWTKLDGLIARHPAKISWRHVDGHVGLKGNECADKLATRATAAMKKEDIVYQQKTERKRKHSAGREPKSKRARLTPTIHGDRAHS